MKETARRSLIHLSRLGLARDSRRRRRTAETRGGELSAGDYRDLRRYPRRSRRTYLFPPPFLVGTTNNQKLTRARAVVFFGRFGSSVKSARAGATRRCASSDPRRRNRSLRSEVSPQFHNPSLRTEEQKCREFVEKPRVLGETGDRGDEGGKTAGEGGEGGGAGGGGWEEEGRRPTEGFSRGRELPRRRKNRHSDGRKKGSAVRTVRRNYRKRDEKSERGRPEQTRKRVGERGYGVEEDEKSARAIFLKNIPQTGWYTCVWVCMYVSARGGEETPTLRAAAGNCRQAGRGIEG